MTHWVREEIATLSSWGGCTHIYPSTDMCTLSSRTQSGNFLRNSISHMISRTQILFLSRLYTYLSIYKYLAYLTKFDSRRQYPHELHYSSKYHELKYYSRRDCTHIYPSTNISRTLPNLTAAANISMCVEKVMRSDETLLSSFILATSAFASSAPTKKKKKKTMKKWWDLSATGAFASCAPVK